MPSHGTMQACLPMSGSTGKGGGKHAVSIPYHSNAFNKPTLSENEGAPCLSLTLPLGVTSHFLADIQAHILVTRTQAQATALWSADAPVAYSWVDIKNLWELKRLDMAGFPARLRAIHKAKQRQPMHVSAAMVAEAQTHGLQLGLGFAPARTDEAGVKP